MNHSAPSGGNLTLIQRVIRACAQNRALTLLGVAVLCAAAFYTLKQIRLDALPDLSDTQVIVYSRWDRSPDIIEDQVTYPIVSALLGAPHVKAIRGFSDFGFSYIYVIFEDGTDIYWARTRVLEYLSKILPRLPEGVQTELGPDATGVGWVYQYALVDRSGKHSADELRSFQDWTLRYALQAVPGVAEVASIGGFQKQYQITVDPNRLAAYGLSLDMVFDAVRASNNEVGGRLIEFAGAEYMVRGKGYARTLPDFEQIVVKTAPGGVPVLLRDIARVEIGPEIRRGISDLDGLRRPRRRHRRDAPRRERAERDRPRQAADGRAEALAPHGRGVRHDLRPLRPDQPRARHPEARAGPWRWSSSRW